MAHTMLTCLFFVIQAATAVACLFFAIQVAAATRLYETYKGPFDHSARLIKDFVAWWSEDGGGAGRWNIGYR